MACCQQRRWCRGTLLLELPQGAHLLPQHLGHLTCLGLQQQLLLPPPPVACMVFLSSLLCSLIQRPPCCCKAQLLVVQVCSTSSRRFMRPQQLAVQQWLGRQTGTCQAAHHCKAATVRPTLLACRARLGLGLQQAQRQAPALGGLAALLATRRTLLPGQQACLQGMKWKGNQGSSS